MFPLNSWAFCFHSIVALESNQAVELRPHYYPLPRGAALALSSLTKYCTCRLQIHLQGVHISLLPWHVFLDDAGDAQPFTPLWCTCSSSPAIPAILFCCRSKVLEVDFISLTLLLPPLCSSSHLRCSSLTYTLTWLLTPSSPNTSMWKSYPYEPLPWVPLYPAFILALTSLIYYSLFTNTNWSFLLPDFKLFLQNLQNFLQNFVSSKQSCTVCA